MNELFSAEKEAQATLTQKKFSADPVWQALNEKRLMLEARVEIQKTLIDQTLGYEETTKTIKQLVEKSIQGQSLANSLEAKEEATQIYIANQNIPKLSLNVKMRRMEVGKVPSQKQLTID